MRTLATLFCLVAIAALAQVAPDEEAPDFTLPDLTGKPHRLSDYRGRFVVLEWFNFDCPFVQKFYGRGTMQKLQKEATEEGVIWLAICSSAPGKQGYYPPARLAQMAQERDVRATAVLQDPTGEVGRRFGARTTPHMFVIDPEGKVIYQGAIDSVPSTDPRDIDRATNYVRAALEAARAGKPVEPKSVPPYGCSVKY